MKKITLTTFFGVAPWIANAQSLGGVFVDSDMVKICLAIICLGLATLFILAMFRHFLDHRIQSKILGMRVPEELAAAILSDKTGSKQKIGIKWSFIFAGLGVDVTICNYTPPELPIP